MRSVLYRIVQVTFKIKSTNGNLFPGFRNKTRTVVEYYISIAHKYSRKPLPSPLLLPVQK